MLTYKGRQIPETFQEIIDPRHTAFIVHEMLNDWCAKGGAFDKVGHKIDASEIVQPMVKLVEEARRQGIRVIYAKYTIHADWSSLPEPDIPRYWDTLSTPGGPPPPAVEGTWGWEIIDELKPQPGDFIVRKYRENCFFGTSLDQLLRWNGIKTIVIAGVGAEVGIVPTVVYARDLGYFVVAVGDCVRPTNPAWREDGLKFIGEWAIVKNHTEVIDVWRSRG